MVRHGELTEEEEQITRIEINERKNIGGELIFGRGKRLSAQTSWRGRLADARAGHSGLGGRGGRAGRLGYGVSMGYEIKAGSGRPGFVLERTSSTC